MKINYYNGCRYNIYLLKNIFLYLIQHSSSRVCHHTRNYHFQRRIVSFVHTNFVFLVLPHLEIFMQCCCRLSKVIICRLSISIPRSIFVLVIIQGLATMMSHNVKFAGALMKSTRLLNDFCKL